MGPRVLVLGALLAGCPSTEPPKDGPDDDEVEDTDPVDDTHPPPDSGPEPLGDWSASDGSRLTRVHLTHEGTAERVFSHFHDTELDAPCRFQRAEDGRMRCLPLGDELILSEGPDCTTLGAYLHRSCREHRYVTDPIYGCFSGDPILERSRVWEITVDPTVTQASDPGRCDLHDLMEDVVFAPLGEAPLPPETFVAATPEVVRTGATVDMVVLVAEDGARMPLGFYDPAREVPCRPTRVLSEDEEVVRCAPVVDAAAAPRLVDGPSWGLPLGFTSDTCETVGAATVEQCAPEDGLDGADAEVLLLASTRRLARVRQLYGLGAGVDGAWRLTSEWDEDSYQDRTVCRRLPSADLEPDATWREIVGELDPAALPRLSQGPTTPGAVSPWAWHFDDGRVAMPTDPLRFSDADGVPCRAVRDGPEGPAHCVPDRVGRLPPGTWFLDDRCEDVPVRMVDAAVAPGDLALSEAWLGTCFGADGPWGLHGGDVVVVDEVFPDQPVYWSSGWWLPQCTHWSPGAFPTSLTLDGVFQTTWTPLTVVDDPREVSDFPALSLE